MYSLVGAVDVINGQDGQIAVVTEVTQGNARTGLELVVVDDLLVDIEGDGHGEDVAIGKAAVLADAMHMPSVFLGGDHFHSNRIIQSIPVIVGLVHETCAIGISHCPSCVSPPEKIHSTAHFSPRQAVPGRNWLK